MGWCPLRRQWDTHPGWHAFLDRFDAHISGAADPTWDERWEIVAPQYQG